MLSDQRRIRFFFSGWARSYRGNTAVWQRGETPPRERCAKWLLFNALYYGSIDIHLHRCQLGFKLVWINSIESINAALSELFKLVKILFVTLVIPSTIRGPKKSQKNLKNLQSLAAGFLTAVLRKTS